MVRNTWKAAGSCTMGLDAVIASVAKTAGEYLRIADTMLYDAKRFGRNRVVWNDENMRQFSE